MVRKEGLRTDNTNFLNKQYNYDNYSKFCPFVISIKKCNFLFHLKSKTYDDYEGLLKWEITLFQLFTQSYSHFNKQIYCKAEN